MNNLIKMIKYDGTQLSDDNGKTLEDEGWHLIDPASPYNRILCSGMLFDENDTDMLYETKQVKRGGITCELCLLTVKAYKDVKL